MKKLFGLFPVLLILSMVLAGCGGLFDGTEEFRAAAKYTFTDTEMAAAKEIAAVENTTRTNASAEDGFKIPSNAHSAEFPGIYFVWQDEQGQKQKDDGYLRVDLTTFQQYKSFYITTKNSDKYYDFFISHDDLIDKDVDVDGVTVAKKNMFTEPDLINGGTITYYMFFIPRQGKNINMVFIDKGDVEDNDIVCHCKCRDGGCGHNHGDPGHIGDHGFCNGCGGCKTCEKDPCKGKDCECYLCYCIQITGVNWSNEVNLDQVNRLYVTLLGKELVFAKPQDIDFDDVLYVNQTLKNTGSGDGSNPNSLYLRKDYFDLVLAGELTTGANILFTCDDVDTRGIKDKDFDVRIAWKVNDEWLVFFAEIDVDNNGGNKAVIDPPIMAAPIK